jgi:hypothetical protein
MPPVVFSTTSFSELEQFMAQTLCNQERLDVGQVKVRRTLMRQGSEIIGLVMRIEGTRMMRSHAIWAERENRILFYDSAGHRFAIVNLSESPEIALSPV